MSLPGEAGSLDEKRERFNEGRHARLITGLRRICGSGESHSFRLAIRLRARVPIGDTSRRQPLPVFRLSSTSRARLVLAAGKIFTQLRRGPLPATLLGVAEPPFSTIRQRHVHRSLDYRFCARNRPDALVFLVLCHARVITETAAHRKPDMPASQNIRQQSLFRLRCPKVCGNRPLVPGDTTLRPPDAAIAQG